MYFFIVITFYFYHAIIILTNYNLRKRQMKYKTKRLEFNLFFVVDVIVT